MARRMRDGSGGGAGGVSSAGRGRIGPGPGRGRFAWVLGACLAGVLTFAGGSAAPVNAAMQDGQSGPDNSSGGSSGGAGVLQGPAGALAAGTGDVTLSIERFGLGETSRPGEISGVRVRARDSGVKPREVLIRLEGRDPDGDTPYFERQVVLNPNTDQGVWLYPLIPRNFDTSDAMVLSAYEVASTGGEAAAGAGTGPEAGKGPKAAVKLGTLLGRATVRMKSRTAPYDAMFAIIGTTNLAFGLGDYGITDGAWSASGHETVQITGGLRTGDLPDRWMGYAGYEVVVWGSGDPLEVRGDRAAALREWVTRGGHLVVIMPVAGQAWTNATANELHDLLPSVTITRTEGVDMSPYAPLLTRRPQGRFPRDAVVYTFEPMADAKVGEGMRVLSGPDGKCVVARRLVGAGAVTLVGLDLNHRTLASQDLVNADVFWNRVLGRRGLARSQAELGALPNRGIPNRDEKLFESDITGSIAKSGRSAAGLLLALVVFAAYWVVAGPGGYAVLKRSGMIRHAWVGFFGAAGVFTAIAWGGAALLRPSRVEVAHLTILDHVYGQPVERARTWMSVLIPWYGQATMEIGEAPRAGELAGRGGGDVLMPWTSPDQAQAGQDMFPDARGYDVETRLPRSLTVPTRSTVKQLRADWSGGPAWKMPTPVADGAGTEGSGAADGNAGAGSGEIRLLEGTRAAGKLVHELPGPLTDVVVIVVRGQKPVQRESMMNQMVSRAFAFSTPGGMPWEPGQVLDLAVVTNTAPGGGGVDAVEYFDRLLKSGTTQDITQASGAGTRDGVSQRLTALGFFSQFEPPKYSETFDLNRGLVARRAETHGWDLGMWFTQPCVIIVGQLGTDKAPSPSPIPMRIDGEPVTPVGRTVVRWIYPLPENPPVYRAEQGAGGGGNGSGEGGEGAAPTDEKK